MRKTGTLSQYLYFRKLNEVAEKKEAYLADMVSDWPTRSAKSGEHRERERRSTDFAGE